MIDESMSTEELLVSIEEGKAILRAFWEEAPDLIVQLREVLDLIEGEVHEHTEAAKQEIDAQVDQEVGRAKAEIEFRRKTAIENINTRLSVALASIEAAKQAMSSRDPIDFPTANQGNTRGYY